MGRASKASLAYCLISATLCCIVNVADLYDQASRIDDTFESSDDFAVKMGEAEERSPRSRCGLDQDTRRKTEEHALSERVGRVEVENDSLAS